MVLVINMLIPVYLPALALLDLNLSKVSDWEALLTLNESPPNMKEMGEREFTCAAS